MQKNQSENNNYNKRSTYSDIGKMKVTYFNSDEFVEQLKNYNVELD
ncbi:hypothetical protein [Nonlabens antarcticus]|nr:hypothetical protein [Nonlabens antarcticus]